MSNQQTSRLHFFQYTTTESDFNNHDQNSMAPSSVKEYQCDSILPCTTKRQARQSLKADLQIAHQAVEMQQIHTQKSLYINTLTSPSVIKLRAPSKLNSIVENQFKLANLLIRYFHVRKFASLLLKKVKLQPHFQTNFIHDKASFDRKMKSDKKKIIEFGSLWCFESSKIFRFIDRIPQINPQDSWKIIWDTLLALIRIYFLIILPLQIAIQDTLIFDNQSLISSTLGGFLVVDLIFRFNTVYYIEGKAVYNKQNF